MIKGFEEQTKELTSYEEEILVPLFIAGLKGKTGRQKAVTNAYIVKTLRGAGHKISEPRVRKIINHIRIKGLVTGLVATSEGYYIATDERELIDYEESLLGRENAIKAVRLSIERQRIEMFHNVQTKIFQ